jgi:transposase
MKTPNFRPYDLGQLILPPDLREWLPEGHLANFIIDVTAGLDLTAIIRSYDASRGGQPPMDPRLMVGLLLYGYCVGTTSSRKIERATHDSVPFRVIAADQHPDHDTIAEFRRRHLPALAELFVQVLRLCQAAGLVKLGHVALDGTKMRANASKHKAMSYAFMERRERELREQVDILLAQAEAADAAEDELYGRGQRGDELPGELAFKQSRLKKIRQAKAALEAEAKERAEHERQEQLQKQAERDAKGQKRRGRAPAEPSGTPDPKAQRNFTDAESRIMKDGASKAFEQCYNAQAAVDEGAQIIVAAEVTQETNDKRQVAPMVAAMARTMKAVNVAPRQTRETDETRETRETRDACEMDAAIPTDADAANAPRLLPAILSADAGYFSEQNIRTLENAKIDAYVATGRIKHGESPDAAAKDETVAEEADAKERMAQKLRTAAGRAIYAKRKRIVEPVFGQIKEARGIRRFLLRGLEKVRAEWKLICATHNLLKLWRRGAAAG